MKTLSVEMRRRILDTYDKGQSTREEVAARYQVSVGMVKKLLQQRRHQGDIAPQHHRSGRKPTITESHQRQMRALLKTRRGLTLEDLRKATGLQCTLPAIHHVLVKMGLKKKRSVSARKGSGVSRRRIARPDPAATPKTGAARPRRKAGSAAGSSASASASATSTSTSSTTSRAKAGRKPA